MTLTATIRRLRPSGAKRTAFALVAVETFLLGAYFAATANEPRNVRYLIYPFVWINVGLWAVARTDPAAGSRRHRLLGAAAGGAYVVLLLWMPGNVGLSHGPAAGLRIGWYAPGWGPLLAYTGPFLRLYLVPFELIGYASLGYLVYASLLDVTRSAVPGLFGLVTCAGCTVPVLAPLVGLIGGPASGLVATAYAWSYDIGTVLYVATIVAMVAVRERWWE